MDCSVLKTILDDLSHLSILPEQLTLDTERELGVGGYADVCLGLLSEPQVSPTKVAVKELRIAQARDVRQRVAIRFARELKVWAKTKHPNILKLLGFHISDDYKCARFVSPYMANGNVKDYVKKNQPNITTRLKFARGIASGLDYLHHYQPPISHGDLKPSNVLVNDDVDTVLCDFGLATFIQESGISSGLTTSDSIKGSTRYMSPDLLQENGVKHTLESDMWALGCTAFEIITDIEPFSSDKETVNVMKSLVLGKPPGSINLLDNLVRPDNDHICHLIMNSLKPLVQACWSSDPAKRPASSDILDCFVSEAEKGPSDGRPLKQTKDYSQVNASKAASASRMAIPKALPSRQAPAFTTLASEHFNKRPLASTPMLTRVAISSCPQLIGPLPSSSSTKSGIGHKQHPLPGMTTSCKPGQGNGARGRDGNQERENVLKKGLELDTRGRYLQLPKSAKSSAGQVDRRASNRQSNLPAKD